MQQSVIKIFTDGACLGNPGPGGWAAILKYPEKEEQITGNEKETTNNRMELQAVISALQSITSPCQLEITTDSKYVKQGITEWIHKWQRNGWRTAGNKPVKNQDLWQELHQLATPHEITWLWVKGHSGDPNNERVDKLARDSALAID